MTPVLVMGSPQNHLAVRCYIDEILVPETTSDRPNASQNVHTRHDYQHPFGIRPHAAVHLAKNPVVQPEYRTGRRQGFADHFSV